MSKFKPENFFDLSDFRYKKLFHEAVYVWDVLKFISHFLQNQKLGEIKGDVSDKAYLIHPELISIGKNSIVEPGAYIKGPCLIGENVVVRHGAYIRGDLIAGDGCVIGHDTEIKNGVMLTGTHAAHFAYVGDSILGSKVNLGAGVKLANLKLNKGEVRVEGIKTGLKKMGAIIGDGVQIGCNTVLNPGTLVGPGTDIFPSLNVGGFIPGQSSVRTSFSVVISQKK